MSHKVMVVSRTPQDDNAKKFTGCSFYILWTSNSGRSVKTIVRVGGTPVDETFWLFDEEFSLDPEL